MPQVTGTPGTHPIGEAQGRTYPLPCAGHCVYYIGGHRERDTVARALARLLREAHAPRFREGTLRAGGDAQEPAAPVINRYH